MPASLRVWNQPSNWEKPISRMDEKQGRRLSKYTHLLEEGPAFRAGHANVVRGSHNTGAHYVLRMEFLCDELYQLAPFKIAAMNRTELMTFVSNVIPELEEERGVIGIQAPSQAQVGDHAAGSPSIVLTQVSGQSHTIRLMGEGSSALQLTAS